MIYHHISQTVTDMWFCSSQGDSNSVDGVSEPAGAPNRKSTLFEMSTKLLFLFHSGSVAYTRPVDTVYTVDTATCPFYCLWMDKEIRYKRLNYRLWYSRRQTKTCEVPLLSGVNSGNNVNWWFSQGEIIELDRNDRFSVFLVISPFFSGEIVWFFFFFLHLWCLWSREEQKCVSLDFFRGQLENTGPEFCIYHLYVLMIQDYNIKLTLI